MAAINVICDEMNEYINAHGELQRSTSKRGLLNSWHDLDNQFWLELFDQVDVITNSTKHWLPSWNERDIGEMQKLLTEYGAHHPNLLNPPNKDMQELPKRLTYIHEDLTVKKCLWRTLMNIRERVYNPFMEIDLPNSDSSIGMLNTTPKQELFDWN